MRSILLGFWVAFIGWGWMTYPTGNVASMDASGAVFFIVGSLVVLYNLVFTKLIPIKGIQTGFTLFYIAWAWDWAFWMVAPAGDYLDLTIGSTTLSMELILMTIGIVAIVYGTYTYLKNPMHTGALQNFIPTSKDSVKNVTWMKLQNIFGKLLGISIEIVFLLFGFSFLSGFLENTPSTETRFTYAVFFILLTIWVLMAIGYFASLAEDMKGIPAGLAGAYLFLLGISFLLIPDGDIIRAGLLLPIGVLIIMNAKDLNSKNYVPGKGMLTGIGCLIAGVFDIIYSPQNTVVGSFLTPSLRGGLFMGYPIIEGIALILVFVVLVIIPRMKVSRKTTNLLFIAPLVLYGLSLIIPLGSVGFAVEQSFSIFWIRGTQMSIITGILALIYSAIRIVPKYRPSPQVFG